MDTRTLLAVSAVAGLVVGDYFQSTFTSASDSTTERTIWGLVGALGAAYVISRMLK